jgi:hypothetical protein
MQEIDRSYDQAPYPEWAAIMDATFIITTDPSFHHDHRFAVRVNGDRT